MLVNIQGLAVEDQDDLGILGAILASGLQRVFQRLLQGLAVLGCVGEAFRVVLVLIQLTSQLFDILGHIALLGVLMSLGVLGQGAQQLGVLRLHVAVASLGVLFRRLVGQGADQLLLLGVAAVAMAVRLNGAHLLAGIAVDVLRDGALLPALLAVLMLSQVAGLLAHIAVGVLVSRAHQQGVSAPAFLVGVGAAHLILMAGLLTIQLIVLLIALVGVDVALGLLLADQNRLLLAGGFVAAVVVLVLLLLANLFRRNRCREGAHRQKRDYQDHGERPDTHSSNRFFHKNLPFFAV